MVQNSYCKSFRSVYNVPFTRLAETDFVSFPQKPQVFVEVY